MGHLDRLETKEHWDQREPPVHQGQQDLMVKVVSLDILDLLDHREKLAPRELLDSRVQLVAPDLLVRLDFLER